MTWNQRWIAKVLLVRWLARLSVPLLAIFVGFGIAAAIFVGEPKAKILGIVSISCFFASFLCALVGRFLMPWRAPLGVRMSRKVSAFARWAGR